MNTGMHARMCACTHACMHTSAAHARQRQPAPLGDLPPRALQQALLQWAAGVAGASLVRVAGVWLVQAGG